MEEIINATLISLVDEFKLCSLVQGVYFNRMHDEGKLQVNCITILYPSACEESVKQQCKDTQERIMQATDDIAASGSIEFDFDSIDKHTLTPLNPSEYIRWLYVEKSDIIYDPTGWLIEIQYKASKVDWARLK